MLHFATPTERERERERERECMQSLCEQKGCGELVNEWKRETESEDVYEKQGING